MARQTVSCLAAHMTHLTGHSGVAVHAVFPRNSAVVFVGANRLVEVARSEGKRMIEAVARLREILAHQAIVRRVTIVTGGHAAMTAPRPRCEDIAHNVAVGASIWVVG